MNIAYVVPILTFCIGVLIGMAVVFVWVAVNRKDK
ncbi:hypothetical protein LCGC14_0873680 [marine sediment metagenome]|uniref:Uncharacterized protein n=1 Tax=marine sediment metagenome TaxID=412755 RepID=A0A0F9RNK3_9ZZZZ